MRFNTQTTVKNKTVNLAGGEAYTQSPELELVSILLTSFVKDQYYRSGNDTIKRLGELLNQVDPEFAAKAALYARNEFGMRSISHVLAGEISKRVKGEPWTKHFFKKIVRRPDDMAEILGYTGLKPVPNAMKKGFAAALEGMDDYQLGKYKMTRAAISMVDIINLVHPKSTPSITKLMKGELQAPETWEVKQTQAGKSENKEEAKAEAWGDLLKENKLPYFALIRNLRNIAEKAPEHLDLALEQLVNEKAIKKSLVLPFRFITALKQFDSNDLERARDIIIALAKAIEISLDNTPKLEGKTLVAIDTSGSMTSWGASDSPIVQASLFGAALYKANNADMMLFDTSAKFINPNPMDSLSTIQRTIIQEANGGGTNFNLIFSEASKPYDRIIILSDMQAWVGYNSPKEAHKAYKRQTECDPHIYCFDLTGYGSMQFPERNVYELAGFSEKVFDIMKLLEQDKNALINTIKKIDLYG